MMAKKVNLDAMIPREDFAIEEGEFALNLFQDFPIANLYQEAPVLKLLRKPDFQRETSHWTPEQMATFVASFLDNEVIPSLILWKSPTYIFVIDGGHRLSALRAWMEDDYGDGAISAAFYKTEISEDQKRIAKRARKLIEAKVGRFSTLKSNVDTKSDTEVAKRAKVLFTRALALQWVQGNASVAESSFFKINSQGTPLDETESSLIRNRRKPIAISARAILRAGSGHKYWSSFDEIHGKEIVELAQELNRLLFEPETDTPLKTLDVPIGGSVSPVDALSLLIEFLTIAGSRELKIVPIDGYMNDDTGDGTLKVLRNTVQVLRRITGNGPGSLGLHPAVYFYNEQGKYSRFLFLGMTALIAEKLRDNNSGWFVAFTTARFKIEQFLLTNKSTIGLVLQNMSKAQRVPKMRDLFDFLVSEAAKGERLEIDKAVVHMGLRARILDLTSPQASSHISDETKSMLFIRNAITKALHCPICNGLLDPSKSVSYDHIDPVRAGGSGHIDNIQLVHPYCNTGYKESGSSQREIE
jgi:Protein of unknown function DUF262.